MTIKQAIVAELGDEDILAPDLIAKSLLANDQVKYYLALLQSARAHSDHPGTPVYDLRAERIACQITDEWLDDVVSGTKTDRAGAYRVPHGPELLRRINASVEDMIACLTDQQRQSFEARLAALPEVELKHGAIPGNVITAMASGDRSAGDSLHLVVMDAHRAINKLQAETAIENVDGARVHRLSEWGRARVEAFMRGLNRTAPLKFDHPGLGTTATEHEGLLLIQNDIGTTDAHVLVVRVHNKVVTINYTDIHGVRLNFFTSLFDRLAMTWDGTKQRKSDVLENNLYMLATGTFEARTVEELDRFIEHLGSRIVFLIDWNKMRKRLRLFVSKSQAIEVLKWAADHDYGHRALFEVGGERTLAEAVEYAAGAQLRYGQRLDDLISPERASAFLKDALRLSSVGLRQRRSRRNIHDEIKARLAGSFERERLAIFQLAADQAAIAFDICSALVDALSRLEASQQAGWNVTITSRALDWEAQADQLLNEARDDIKRFARPRSLLEFLESADDAIDAMEEAVALLEMARLTAPPQSALGHLKAMAESPLRSAQELVKAVECAASITRSDVREDLDDFMLSLEQLMAIEHEADAAERAFLRWLILEPLDHRQMMVLRELSAAIEMATDAQVHAGQSLRRYLMEEVIA